MRVTMWGGGGGGEFVALNRITTADGGDGGDSSWVGITCRGGQGGGRSGGKNSLGSGGGVINGYPNADSRSGADGQVSTGAIQVGGRGNGGNGTIGQALYGTFSYHEFDNDTNQHLFTSTSPDITADYRNPSAPDGIYGFTPLNGKYYSIRFVVPYIDNNWTFSVTDVCNQAAGGGTARQPYTYQGSRNKTANGIDLWFQNRDGGNSYIRCFEFSSNGIKPGAPGRGGGAGGYINVTISRQSLINAGYSPGATYTATIGGGGAAGGNTAAAGGNGFLSLFMYIIPTVTLTVNKTEITIGDCVTLTWNTIDDADIITWTSGNVSNNNLSSSEIVCPTETTTYTVVASGLGGSSPPASVTVIVYSPPTASISSPETLNYGDQGLISFETEYANTSITITPYYRYKNLQTDSFEIVVGDPVSIAPATSAIQGNPGTVVSNPAFPTSIPYNESGPYNVQYVLVAEGQGGQVTVTTETEILVDITPDNLIVPETEGRFKSENPVFAPQTEILSDMLYVDGVDVPIEIKSSSPIQVDINNQDDWKDLRPI